MDYCKLASEVVVMGKSGDARYKTHDEHATDVVCLLPRREIPGVSRVAVIPVDDIRIFFLRTHKRVGRF
jgi:hypothetical protein